MRGAVSPARLIANVSTVPVATGIARPTFHLLMNYVMTPTSNCSTRLFAYLITCYIPSFRRHLAHHKDTICETERIYCSYLIIPHTCQTKTSSLTCCIKTHTDTALCSYTVICNLLANLLMKQFRRLSMTFFSVTCTFSFTFLLLWHAFCHVTNKRI